MLIALITFLLLGGGSTGLLDYISETDDNIKVVMEKDERQKEALATVTKSKKRTKARNKRVKKSRKELSKALADHGADRSAIDSIWDAYYAEVEAYNKDMLELRFELKDRLTREEWRQVFSED